MTNGKELVGTHWINKSTGERILVKDQFRVGGDIESWCDCRNDDNLCTMIMTDTLVREYSRIYLEFQNTH